MGNRRMFTVRTIDNTARVLSVRGLAFASMTSGDTNASIVVDRKSVRMTSGDQHVGTAEAPVSADMTG